MNSYRNNPEGKENQKATHDTDRYVGGLKLQETLPKMWSDSEFRLRCNRCGKIVSTPVPESTIVRAWIECPECIEAKP